MSASSLRAHLLERISTPIAEFLALIASFPEEEQVELRAVLDPEKLVELYEQAIVFFVHALVETPYRDATLAHPELAQQWKLTEFGRLRPDDFTRSTLHALAQGMPEKGGAWPSNVTNDEIRDALLRTRDDDAATVAEVLERGLIVLQPNGRADLRNDAYTEHDDDRAKLLRRVRAARKKKPFGETDVIEALEHDVAKELPHLSDVERFKEVQRRTYAILDTLEDWGEGRVNDHGDALPAALKQGLELWPLGSCALVVSVAKRVRTAEEITSSPRAAAAFAWRRVAELTRDDPSAIADRSLIAFDVLRAEEKHKTGQEFVTDPNARSELERELRRHIDRLREAVGMHEPPPSTDEEASATEDEILAWDARFARYLETLGATGKKAASAIRQNATNRQESASSWQLWADPNTAPMGSRFAQVLALILWRDVVQPRMRKPASLVFPVYTDVTRVHSRIFRHEEMDGQRMLVFPDDSIRLERIEPLQVPAFELTAVEAMLSAGLDKLGSVTAHRLLRWEVIEGHRQVLAGNQDPRSLRVEGGWSGLADRLHLPAKMRDDLHAIVIAQAHCAFNLPGGAYGNLLSYMVWPARGRRRGEVTIVLGDALLPHFVFELRQKLGEGRAAYEAQRLVPMIDLPPFVGRPNEHGAQATMSMAMVAEMRAQAVDVVKEGGAKLDLLSLAVRSGVKPSLAPRILDRWLQDGTDAPAFLKSVGKDRFILGDAHEGARTFIEKAGRATLAASESGKRSSVARDREKHRWTKRSSKR